MQICHCAPSAAKAVSAARLWRAAHPGLGQVLAGMVNEAAAPIKLGQLNGAKWQEGGRGWAIPLNGNRSRN